MKLSGKLGSIFRELKRRRVINTVLLYVVSSWIILQVIDVIFPFLIDNKTYFYIYVAIFFGLLPVVIGISWFYQITPRGFVKVAPFVERRVLNNLSPKIDRRMGFSRDTKTSDETSGWSLFAESGPAEGLEYEINKTTVIGRAVECEITLLRSYISRNHARLSLSEGRLIIEDLGSANGTLVNGAKISAPSNLHHGDNISFKDVVFRVREDRSAIRGDALSSQTIFIDQSELN